MGHACLFCSIVARTIPHEIVDETRHALAFMDAHPAAYGHALVIPKRHADDIWELSPDDGRAVWDLTHRLAHAVRESLEPDGLNLFCANRRAAWQSEFHFHIHVVPRWHGDPLVRNWQEPQGREDQIGAAAAKLRKGLPDNA